MKAYQQKIFFKTKPVFDGRKNLYSRDHLPIGTEKVSREFECVYERERERVSVWSMHACGKLLKHTGLLKLILSVASPSF